MRAPVRPLRGRWPTFAQRGLSRWFWADPTVVLAGADADPVAFRTAMNAFHLGGTIKITGSDRHRGADDLVLALDRSDLAIADIGASDGSTSLDLISRLPGYRSFVISDRHLHVRAVSDRAGRTVFFDPAGVPVLVVGRHALAWPSLSKRVAWLYRRSLTAAHAALDRDGQDVLLLNPAVQALVRADPRVSYRAHDVFETWSGDPVDVVKVANLLRRLYFSDGEISRALTALLASLPDGGHLLVVDNPRIAGIAYRAGMYRRDQDRFTLVGVAGHPPEIADLVEATVLGPQQAGSGRDDARGRPA